MTSTVVLPPEIISKIVEIAADSDKIAAASRLCFVSQLFHQRAISRLYHTLFIHDKATLKKILRTSIPPRPWIASRVRVLNLLVCPPDLLSKTLTTFENIRALRLPLDTELDPAPLLPNLHRLHMTSTSIASHVAQNLTHLYFYESAYDTISQLMQRQKEFPHLTHFLILDRCGQMSTEASLERTLDLLHKFLPNGLPETLKVFVLNSGSLTYKHLNRFPNLSEKLQQIAALDRRVVFWNQEPGIIPSGWNGPRILDFHSGGSLITQALEALPDGTAGIWEHAEVWIRENKKFY
ncbi:hypothetical protein DL96DRAFT_1613251, partial [Flagelloscypha sp. PMI_526]